ncbi:MAG: SET domain-containing protein-lysine N-methyltransferase [Cystobacter sp.]
MNVYVTECRLGRGLFAAAGFERGEVILTFTGRVRGLKEILGRTDSFNLLQVSRDGYLDLESPGLFVNHSCEPNAGVCNNTTLIALRDIRAGEEIQYDYSTTMDEDLETMACGCGSRKCRGVVRDFRHLPMELKRNYLMLGLVQDFIHARECSLRRLGA